MTDSVTYNGDVEELRESAEGVRATEGPRGTVDVYDDRFGIFRRLDEGDKVERFGKGFTVVREVEPLGTDKNVSTRGAQGDEDTSEAGGFLTAQNPNVQEEVKEGGPTDKDELDKAKAEGGKERKNSAKKTASAKKSEDNDDEQAKRDEVDQAKASQGNN